MTTIYRALIIVPLLLTSTLSLFGQGSLSPPDAPAPTMKTLTEIEPRTAINDTNTPGDVDSLYTITQPGSYYLTGNITGVTTKHGIKIAVAGVTLDLMGFELAGVADTLDGVNFSASVANAAIRNGVVRDWGGVGVNAESTTNGQYKDLRLSSNGSGGIRAGVGSTVTGCTATGNTGSNGIDVSFGSTVSGCTTRSNGLNGIFTANGCTVSGCTAYTNGNRGIFTSSECTVSGCTATINNDVGIFAGGGSTVSGCTASDNHKAGIVSETGSAITGCTASFNYLDGIQVTARCRVVENTCVGNGIVGVGHGIETTGSNNRLDSNQAIGNSGYGVKSSSGTADFIIRNVCYANAGTVSATATADYSPKSGSYFGPLSLPGTATSPWANF